jgi:hypothetical protein
MAFVGIACMAWLGAAELSRQTAAALAVMPGPALPPISVWLVSVWQTAPLALDVLGVLWLALGLLLISGASRQRWSVSWPWLAAICQTIAAAGLLALTAWAATPANLSPAARPAAIPLLGLGVLVAVGLTLWLGTLAWLLASRRRARNRARPGPGIRDGLRTFHP